MALQIKGHEEGLIDTDPYSDVRNASLRLPQVCDARLPFSGLLGAVADMQAHHLAQALLEWHVHRVAEMPVQLQAQVNSLEGEAITWPLPPCAGTLSSRKVLQQSKRAVSGRHRQRFALD